MIPKLSLNQRIFNDSFFSMIHLKDVSLSSRSSTCRCLRACQRCSSTLEIPRMLSLLIYICLLHISHRFASGAVDISDMHSSHGFWLAGWMDSVALWVLYLIYQHQVDNINRARLWICVVEVSFKLIQIS